MTIRNIERGNIIKSFHLNGNVLKWIAILTMLIDHIGAVILEKGLAENSLFYNRLDIVLRLIGRVAFPIFCFLLVEGFLHTHNFKRYLFSLIAFSALSEVPFDLAVFGKLDIKHQNVYFTLWLGLLTIYMIDRMEKRAGKYLILQKAACILAGALAAFALHTDYGAVGVLLICILYMTRKNRAEQCLLGAVCLIEEVTSVFAFLLIYFYDGTRKKGINRYFFYFFYPVHLLLLYGVYLLIQ